VPTLLIDGGMAYPGIEAGSQLIDFESNLLRLQVRWLLSRPRCSTAVAHSGDRSVSPQMQFEDSVIGIARSYKAPTVIICDRGTMDISAYLLPNDWQVGPTPPLMASCGSALDPD
jgi:hypothetical protein